MSKKTISRERLASLLEYDSNSGEFRSLVKRGPLMVGQIVGTKSKSGYIQIQISGSLYYGHRLAWLYVYGKHPSEAIDHIDGNRSNNSIANLREAFRAINQQNQRRPRADNKSGYLGVSQHKDGKWTARIKTSKTYQHIGLYATPELAYQAYLAAKRMHHEGNTI
jgi:hypothetical protein